MDIKKEVLKTRAKLRLNMLAGFKQIGPVILPQIPNERTLFPGTKNDYWYKIESPHNVDATYCIYEFDVGSIFEPHYHANNTEQIILLTPGAKLEVITEEKEYEIKFPGGTSFPKNLSHAVINKSDKPCMILVIWTPKMRGFEMDYFKKEKIDDTNI